MCEGKSFHIHAPATENEMYSHHCGNYWTIYKLSAICGFGLTSVVFQRCSRLGQGQQR